MVHFGLENQSAGTRSDRQVALLLSTTDRSVLEGGRGNDEAAGQCRDLFDVDRATPCLQRKRARHRVEAPQKFACKTISLVRSRIPASRRAPALVRASQRSALAFAANELLDAAIGFVVGHLDGRMFGEIGRGRMQHATNAAIKRKLAATDSVDGHAG